MTQLTDDSRIFFVTPQNDSDFEQYQQPFLYLYREIWPELTETAELLACIRTRLGKMTLVYYQDFLVGVFELWEFRQSVELHGIYAPHFQRSDRFSKLLRRKIKYWILSFLIRSVFQLGKKM